MMGLFQESPGRQMKETKEFKYCMKRLRKIYPNAPDDYLKLITGIILVAVASSDLNEAISELGDKLNGNKSDD